MNIACICLNQNLNKTHTQEIIINKIKDELLQIGEQVSLISYFDFTYNSLNQIIKSGTYDYIYIIGSNSTSYNSSIKQAISQILNEPYEVNSECRCSIIEYCKKQNIPFSIQEEAEAYLPNNCTPLTNNKHSISGFIGKYNNTTLVFVPSVLSFVNDIFSLILPLNESLNYNFEHKFCFKCYGILEKDIRLVLTEELSCSNTTIQILTKRLDSAIFVTFNKNDPRNRDIVSSICEKLKKFIYATDNISLDDMAIQLLQLHKKNISTAETITMGNLAKRLTLKSNNIIQESLLFNNPNSLQKIFNRVKIEGYSVNLVYELDNLLLERTGSDIAVFVLGNVNDRQCFIAIGDIDGIHVYKNNINTFDEELVDILTDTTMFYLIKKLRQNDLQFL